MTTGVPTQALVLCAGLGRRLRPLTQVRAKPAVPVAGEALVRRVLRWLRAQGVREAVLNLHHLPASITRHVGDGTDLGLRVRYTWEPRLLGSAGGPRAMMPLCDPAPTLIVNGDTLTELPLAAMADDHRRHGARVTLAVVEHPDRRRYGGIIVDAAGWVRGFRRAGHAGPSMHFVGIQIADPDVFGSLPPDQPASTIGGLFDRMLERGDRTVRAHQVQDRFLDIGTPRDYLATCLAVARADGLEALPAGAGSRIDATARVTRTAVWDDVVVEAGCDLTDCVVTDGVRVAAGTRLTAQILLSEGRGDPLAVPLDGGSGTAEPGSRRAR